LFDLLSVKTVVNGITSEDIIEKDKIENYSINKKDLTPKGTRDPRYHPFLRRTNPSPLLLNNGHQPVPPTSSFRGQLRSEFQQPVP
jgi:hypothetical protein